MEPRPQPYYLDEAFCREHGHKGPAQLSREFTDCRSWHGRRQHMHNAYPLLVPTLDRQGVAKYTAPECVESPGRKELEAEHKADPDNYGESVEIREDGSCTSDKLIAMNAEQCKSREYMLTVHGFDPAEWEIVTARNNIWNMASKRIGAKGQTDGHDIAVLYSSKITVRPLTSRFDIDAICAAVAKLTPHRITRPRTTTGGMLEISPDDMHWGIATAEHYRPTRERMVAAISERKRDEVVLTIGSDLFHNNGFRGTTASGTQIECIDFTSAWDDAADFFMAIIPAALAHSARVVVKYVKGNHDEAMAWAFCKMLAAMFPQCEFDLAIEERKVHRYGEVCVGFTHGDKGRDLDRIFLAEFPDFYSAAVREIHSGHLHHESAKDTNGVMVRVLPTAGVTDQWSRDKGYTGSNKRFQIFEYSTDALTAIRYV